MRRVRQSSTGLSRAIDSRIPAAVALSAALHLYLIYGFSLPALSGPAAWAPVINARLAPLPPSATPRQTNAPERSRVPEPVPRAVLTPVLLEVAEPLAAPKAAAIAAEPEHVVAASDATAIPNIPDPVHYPARDLDIYPHALNPIRPVYPQAAREAQVAGSVTLLVLIDEAGRVPGHVGGGCRARRRFRAGRAAGGGEFRLLSGPERRACSAQPDIGQTRVRSCCGGRRAMIKAVLAVIRADTGSTSCRFGACVRPTVPPHRRIPRKNPHAPHP